jgi:bifunctional non-homologous end joining protein LigD
MLVQLLNPIESAEAKRLLDNPAWLMQEKKDGVRCILEITSAGVKATNRKGLAMQIPSAVRDSARRLENCVLDGELVGNTFFAFDLICAKPFHLRYAKLIALIGAGIDAIEIVPIQGDKRAGFERFKAHGAEGVVFKRADSSYTPGRPTRGGDWLKFKFVQTATCISRGQNPGTRSIGLELHAVGARVFVGNVTVPANQTIPAAGALVEVRYLKAYRNGSLFQPVLLGVRDDIGREACTTEQLKYRYDVETLNLEKAYV